MTLATDDLGGHVVPAADHLGEDLARPEERRVPKVDRLDRRRAGRAHPHQVLQLDVAVRDAVQVALDLAVDTRVR